MSVIRDILYTKHTDILLADIANTYDRDGYGVVNFLYFANAMQYHLYEKAQSSQDTAYKTALEASTFLLPDGIALQTWHYLDTKPHCWLHNLNGTDLTPKILSYMSEKYTVVLYIVSLYDERIGKGPERLQKAVDKSRQVYGIQEVYAFQTRFAERGTVFPRDERDQTIKQTPIPSQEAGKKPLCRIVLHCTGTPFQEIWTHKHRDWYQKNNMLVLNVGGFIDFFTGFEKRAPQRAVRGRVFEALWRLLTNPKKNAKKIAAMFGVRRVVGKRSMARIASWFKTSFPFFSFLVWGSVVGGIALAFSVPPRVYAASVGSIYINIKTAKTFIDEAKNTYTVYKKPAITVITPHAYSLHFYTAGATARDLVKDTQCLAALNGTYFGYTAGGYMPAGVRYEYGNFIKEPYQPAEDKNLVVLLSGNGNTFDMIDNDTFDFRGLLKQTSTASWYVNAGPRLVRDGKINTAVLTKTSHRQRSTTRTAVIKNPLGDIHFLVATQHISLPQFISFAYHSGIGTGAFQLVNLDGGSSTALYTPYITYQPRKVLPSFICILGK